MRILLIVLVVSQMLLAAQDAKVQKLILSGEKIAHTFCDEGKFPSSAPDVKQMQQKLSDSHACGKLPDARMEAIAHYLFYGRQNHTSKHLHVPDTAKCPVCGMFVAKYPKWAASMEVDGKTLYFDGVKDMMKYYIFDGDFIYDRKQISKITVTDYYTLEAIDAKAAFYVLDANVYGPMGRELIPFKTLEKAKTFMQEHKGEKIVGFNEITAKMVMALDGIGQ